MDKELQTMGQNMLQKESIVRFVEGVADMETRAFSMREAADRCRREAANIVATAKKQVEKKEKEVEVAKYWRDKHVSDGIKKPKLEKRFFFEPMLDMASGCDHWSGLVVMFLIPPCYVILIPVLLYCLLIDPFVILIQNKKRVKEYNIKLQQATDEYNSKLAELDANVDKSIKQLADAQAWANSEFLRAKAINSRADELIASAKTVEQNILQCYSLNVVKPAYRNLVCVAILNEIFQNDKADTMREAMILCDQALRHQEEMKGLNSILNMLSSIAGYMRELNETVRSINFNISMISQDVYRMAENQAQAQARNEAMQERIAYAAESIKQSADNADFYIAQRRAGSL